MKDLREFINLLETRDQLVRIDHQVSAYLEITEITDRISKSPAANNKALLFENVSGSNLPVIINAFGSRERISWALEVDDLEELNQRLAAIIDPRLPNGFRQMIQMKNLLVGYVRGLV